MSSGDLQRWIDEHCERDAMPALCAYVAIPAISPAFDKNWVINGQIDHADGFLAEWARARLETIPGALHEVKLRLSLRLPPNVVPGPAAVRLMDLLEANPRYGCEVRFEPDMISTGWSTPELSPALRRIVATAAQAIFARPPVLFGGGGGIPFLAMLEKRFPATQFVVTGVLGPRSNAHGPNEFLHVPMARHLTAALALILRDLG